MKFLFSNKRIDTWQRWFAWYPTEVYEEYKCETFISCRGEETTTYYRGHTAWLHWIERKHRKVPDPWGVYQLEYREPLQ